MDWTRAVHSCEAVCSLSAYLCQTPADAQRVRGQVAVSVPVARPGRPGKAGGWYQNAS